MRAPGIAGAGEWIDQLVDHAPSLTSRVVICCRRFSAWAGAGFASPGESHWDNLGSVLTSANAGSNLVTDAHIAALTADYGLVIHSDDTGQWLQSLRLDERAAT